MIGGAPITQNYADQIGADGCSPDAASAVDKAKTFIA
jgi:5-methyltetrahydrofolate--homocysteine methyltransferase